MVAPRARLAGAALALATPILDELPRLDRDLVERLAGDRHGAQRCVPLAERDRDGTDQTDVLSAELGGAAGGVGEGLRATVPYRSARAPARCWVRPSAVWRRAPAAWSTSFWPGRRACSCGAARIAPVCRYISSTPRRRAAPRAVAAVAAARSIACGWRPSDLGARRVIAINFVTVSTCLWGTKISDSTIISRGDPRAARLARSRVMTSRLVLVACLVAAANGFKFMANWKMPSISRALKSRQTAEKFGDKKLVVVTGTSSGLGRKTALAMLRTGKYHVVGGVRDLDKMEAVAEIDGFDMENFTPMHLDLNSFDSVRRFHAELDAFKLSKPVDRLLCNAGVYQPSLPYPKWSEDNHEQTMQSNFLSHFLLISLLMPGMVEAPDPRITMVGSVTGNDNTVGGGGVYPIADLHELDGFRAGFTNPVCMADGYSFDGAKAYKDSKLCLMMLSNILHSKYNKQTGIAFSSIYPGCIAESPLFREKRPWFRKYFPVFMKFITGGFVTEVEAGQRLFQARCCCRRRRRRRRLRSRRVPQVAHDPRCSKSGVYWSWNGWPREGRGDEALEKGGQITGAGGGGGGWDSIYENDQSDKARAMLIMSRSRVPYAPVASEPARPHGMRLVGECALMTHDCWASDRIRCSTSRRRPTCLSCRPRSRGLSGRRRTSPNRHARHSRSAPHAPAYLALLHKLLPWL